MSEAAPPSPVRTVGRYVLYGPIASGGMATVHLGRLIGAAGFARTVAVKRLHPHMIDDPEFVTMFVDEARLAERIRHPNVVPTLDVVTEGGELFIVMEYVAGESVSRLLKATHEQGLIVGPAVACAIACDVLRGLHAAHEATDEHGAPLSIVHRDVSPQNVLVGVDGVARLLDFGVAKAARRLYVTRELQLKGKLGYMAPEQITEGEASRSTDIYAASIVLWECLAGKRLYWAENDAAMMHAIVLGTITPPSAARADAGGGEAAWLRAVDAVVLKGLARKPEDRFANAAEMADELGRVMPPARREDIGAWVRATAGALLRDRTERVAEIEREPSGRAAPAPDALMAALRSERASGPLPASPSDPDATKTRVASEAPSGTGALGGIAHLAAGPPRGLRGRRLSMALGLAFVVAAGFGLRALVRSGRPEPVVATSPSATPLPVTARAVAITDHPPPATTSGEARAAYAAGLQGLRDGSFARAFDAFERATAADPALGSAHLRLAIGWSTYSLDESAAREEFGKAAAHRASMDARDQALLAAIEPYFQTQPADVAESDRRLSKILAENPTDSEVWFFDGMIRFAAGAFDRSLAAFDRSLELDPGFAIAASQKGSVLWYAGDAEGAIRTLDACIAESMSGSECFYYRLLVDEQRGECQREEEHAKQWLAKDSTDFYAYSMLAQAIAGQGRPLAEVQAALEQGWSKAPAASRARRTALDRANLALLGGDFAQARTILRDAQATVEAADPSALAHSWSATSLLGIATEEARRDEAAAVAEAFLAHKSVWVAPLWSDDWTLSLDPTPRMLLAKRGGGRLSAAAFEAGRREWVERMTARTQGALAGYVWVFGYAAVAETREDATTALAALADIGKPPTQFEGDEGPDHIGTALLRAGKASEAVPWLKRSVASCIALTAPLAQTRAMCDLGEALEATGDRAGACAAYGAVLARWGRARPRSVTAERARRRAAGLRCGT